MSVAGRKPPADIHPAWLGEPDPALAAGTDAAETAHAPTARVVRQLRQARLKLERAASPELGLDCAIRALLRTELRLARPLRVAILGEINAGKSSLANLLAGIESLPTAVISNTRFPTLLYYAREPEIWTASENGRREQLHGDHGLPQQSIFRVEVGLPSPRLREIQILDLPGLSDPMLGGPAVDLAAHRVDAAVWCTMSTQAWKESERTAWSALPARLNTRGLLVATHGDLLHERVDRGKLLARLRHEAGTCFKGIVLLSTLEALAAMSTDPWGPAALAWVSSGAETLANEFGAMLLDLREQRAAAALRMTSRVAQHALARIDDEPSPGWAATH